jgi:tRNA 2-thiouridine synthesizing protein A
MLHGIAKFILNRFQSTIGQHPRIGSRENLYLGAGKSPLRGIVNTVGEILLEKQATLDARGLMCPMPIVNLAKKLKEMKSGQVLELLADDVGAKEDVPAWCSRTGNELIGTEEEGKLLKFYIRIK